MKIRQSGNLLTTGGDVPRMWITHSQITLIIPFTLWQGLPVVYAMSPNDVALDYRRAKR